MKLQTLLRNRTTPTSPENARADTAWLVVGLGNPGPRYAHTRHNVGAMVVGELADRAGAAFKKASRAEADVVETRAGLPGQPVPRMIVAKPRTFMNTSGGAVAGLSKFYGITPQRLIVIHDELDIDEWSLRLKLGGGDNGHNGLKSIRASLGSGEFYRVRFGIGRPPGRQDPADYVLKDFPTKEAADLAVAVDRAADAVVALINEGLVSAQNTYNQ